MANFDREVTKCYTKNPSAKPRNWLPRVKVLTQVKSFS